MEHLGNPDVWAQFGLIGLIVFALFLLVMFLILENRRNQREFVACLTEIGKMIDVWQKENNATINALALSIERNTYGCNKK